MLKRKKNVIMLAILFIVAVGLCMIYNRTNCIKLMIGKICYNFDIFDNYDRLLKKYGKPQNEYVATYNKIECWVVCYDGATAVYAYDSEKQEKDYLINAVISSDSFWKGRSFIGWEKSKIEKKFKNSCRATRPQLKKTYFKDGSKMEYEIEPYYQDEYLYGIGFIYDEDNIVEKVVLTCGLN